MITPDSVRRTVLGNGLTVLVRRDSTAPAVAIVTHVRAGYFDEDDDVVGIAHVLEHMYFKGTPRRGVGEIARATKAAGGYLNAGTIYDHTVYYAVLPSSGFLAGLEVQADAYASSLIDADELRRELEVIIQEAKRKADTPAAVTTETLYELLHDRHRMRRWRIGREDGLRGLRREDVVAFYRNFYRPRNTILSIVGDIDPDAALRAVDRLYGALPDDRPRRSPGPVEPDRRDRRVREIAGDITPTHFAVGWRTPPTLHEDTPRLEIGAAVLSAGRASRLYRAVREGRLAATIAAYDYTPTELGVFVIQGDGPPATTLEALRASWAEVRDLGDRGPGDDEIARVRSLLESRWIKRLETMEGQATHLAAWEALGDWQLGTRHQERLLAVSGDEVRDAMRRWLDPESCAAVVFRPEGAASVAGDADAFWSALDGAPPARRAEVAVIAAPGVATGSRAVLDREEAGVRVYRTPSGVPVLVSRKSGAPLVHLGVHALGGACDERADRAGLTLLMARGAVKGTERRTAAQIAEEAELLGGSIAPSTGAESFGWSLSVPARRADAAMALLADVVQHPVFADHVVETERAVAIADAAQARDDMHRWPLRLLARAAFPGHPYGVPAAGDEHTLAAIGPEEIRGWHASRVIEAPTVIAVVGDVDPDEAAALAARHFDRLAPAVPAALESPRWPVGTPPCYESRDKAQTAIALAFPGPARDGGDRFAVRLLMGVASGLGGRLFEELRDRQSLAYSVTAQASERRLAGTVVAYIATSPDREETARQGLLRELARLAELPVTDSELARAREYAIGTHAIRQQSGAAVLADLVDLWLFGPSLAELAGYESIIRGVTTIDVREAARRWIDPASVVEAGVRGVVR